MADLPEVEKAIMSVHDLFWDALAARDLDTRFTLCDPNVTFFGTGLNERAENKAAYKEINQKGVKQFPNPFKIEFLWKKLTVFGNTAWVECEVMWHQEINNSMQKEQLRNTTILKYENNKWMIAHVHGSSPDYRLQGEDYMPTASTIIKNNELEKQVRERTNELNEALQNLRSTQAQLIQSEKMASLGELTAGIAHEIQNPLNFVNNFSEVNKELLADMKAEIDKGNFDEVRSIADDVMKNQEKINHHGKRADAIVKGMLQHSRTSSGQKELTDINVLCDEYLRLAYHGLRAKDKSFNAKIETDFDPSIEKINIVPQEIGRVILNLINNAFYAVNERRKVEGLGHEPAVRVSTAKENGKVAIHVTDNGNGIPQEIVDKIFQPFFTTKQTGQGTGLGLSLAYDIVKAHGGEIKVATKEGQGSDFIIQLPTTSSIP